MSTSDTIAILSHQEGWEMYIKVSMKEDVGLLKL
jgi:hypothetical protein